MDLKCTVDVSKLQAAINQRVKYPGRTEAEVVNRSAFWVAYNTMNDMPFSTVQRIDTELGVAVNLRVTKRGKFSKDKRRQSLTGGRQGSYQKEIPLAVLIIQARSNLISKYSFKTNGRYFAPSPFKGKSRAAGAAAMNSAVSRLIKARHSSTKFLLAGWLAAVRGLFKFKGNKSAPVGGLAKSNSNYSQYGGVIVAQEGSPKVLAMIENRVGLEGVNGPNFNKAMLLYGIPALQRAIDREEVEMLKYMIERTNRLNAQFNAMA